MPRLSRAFFSRYTPDVARALLGCIIVRAFDDVTLKARIVEVDAYRGSEDPASHSYKGLTKRTSVLFGEAGHAYVYFIYGNHYCLNFTTEAKGVQGGVLIRAAEPLRGLEEMRRRRGVEELTNLMSGPGKLTKAMGIDLNLNGEDVTVSRKLYLLGGAIPGKMAVSTRIGVSAGGEREWRFYVEDSPFVSGARMHNYRIRAAARRGVVG